MTEAIKALKKAKAHLENPKKNLQKFLHVDNTICDVVVKNTAQSKATDFFKA